LGADPETLPKVKELRARLAQDAVDLDALEAEVYDHLYSFFRRYYSEGDFLSKRVYKPGVYAIPYEGEEVKLHWANADQYYIKTSEYLRDYAFRLRPEDATNPMRVHFRLVDATEGEHGNVKEAAGKERRFKLAQETPVAVEGGQLVIRFTYEPDPKKQRDLNAAAEERILRTADVATLDWIRALGQKHVRTDGTESEATRLRVHLDRYTARNTFDYFIHKDRHKPTCAFARGNAPVCFSEVRIRRRGLSESCGPSHEHGRPCSRLLRRFWHYWTRHHQPESGGRRPAQVHSRRNGRLLRHGTTAAPEEGHFHPGVEGWEAETARHTRGSRAVTPYH